MLLKKNRANKKAVDQIFKLGKFLNSPNLTLKFVKTSSKIKQVSVVVPKGVSKLAVKRNLLRRRTYSVLKKYFNQFPSGFLGVLVFKKYQDDIFIIENEIKNIINKIN